MMRRLRILATGAAVGLLLAACQSPAPATSDCGDPDAAVMDLREAWKTKPCAGLYEQGGCDDGAERRSKELIRRQGENLAYRHPRHVPTLMFSALTAYEAGEVTRAIEHLDDVLQLQPGHAEAAVLRARIALEKGNVVYARRLLEGQIDLNPDHARLREALASVCFMSDDHDAALLALDAAERLGSPRWRTAYNRGLVEEARGRETRAIEHYRASLAALPRWAPPSARLRGLEAGHGAPVPGLATTETP